VTGTQRRAPSPDRQERDVDVAEIAHRVEEVGVAREVHTAPVALDQIADRLGTDP
jgi:hypothetical protein